jgi:hypothetical protein
MLGRKRIGSVVVLAVFVMCVICAMARGHGGGAD